MTEREYVSLLLAWDRAVEDGNSALAAEISAQMKRGRRESPECNPYAPNKEEMDDWM